MPAAITRTIAFATVFVGSGEGETEVVLELLFGSTVHETRNTDKIKISRDTLIALTPFAVSGATSVPFKYSVVFLLAWTISGQ